MKRNLIVGFLVACGGGSSTPPDASPDAVLDAPEAPPGVTRFVIDKEKVPTTSTQARDFGLDLDGDAMVDNQLGMVLATLAGQGFDVQTTTDQAVSRGQILQLAEMTMTPPTLAMFYGANAMPSPCAGAADTTCRHHLMGTGSFEIAMGSPRETPLAVAGMLAGPGHLPVQLVILGTQATPITLIGAKVKLVAASATALDLVVAGGVTVADRDAKIYPGIRDGANQAIMRDCTTTTPPDCGCAAGSTGKTMVSLLDASPKDCKVSLDEVKNNTLFQNLFAPDVTLESQQAISIGISATAVHAGFPN